MVSCRFPTEEIMGAQNFTLPLKMPENEGFSTQIWCFGKKIFQKKSKILGNCCHNATDNSSLWRRVIPALHCYSQQKSTTS